MGCALAVILIIAIIFWFRHVQGQKKVKPSAAVVEKKLEQAESPADSVEGERGGTIPPRKRSELPVDPGEPVSPSVMGVNSHRDSDAATVFTQARSNAAQLLHDISPVTSPAPKELPANGLSKSPILTIDISPVTSPTPKELPANGLSKSPILTI